MLYDPKWEVKTDPFTLESLIAWLEKQPDSERYDYTCNGHCLMAQYFTAMGFKGVEANPSSVIHRGGDFPLPKWFNAIALGGRCAHFAECNYPNGPSDRTFGAALIRSRAALAAR